MSHAIPLPDWMAGQDAKVLAAFATGFAARCKDPRIADRKIAEATARGHHSTYELTAWIDGIDAAHRMLTDRSLAPAGLLQGIDR